MEPHLARVRDAALALPEVVEGTSYGTPGFRVGKTLFARFWEDGETLVLKVDLLERDVLLAAEPEKFFLTDHYRGYPWILVRLSRVTPVELGTLLRRAWREAAPRKPREQEISGPERGSSERVAPRQPGGRSVRR